MRATATRVERRLTTIEAGLNQHLTDCMNQNKQVENRLWRVEWLIIVSAAAIMGMLVKLAFFPA